MGSIFLRTIMQNIQPSVTAIIVTFNRKELLLRCLNEVANQTIKPEKILIVDNASKDGTVDFLKSKGWLSRSDTELLALRENIGGAGGFEAGMRHALLQNQSWLWLMDDDGFPEKDCLEKLLYTASVENSEAISPIQADINNHSLPAFPIRAQDGKLIKELPFEQKNKNNYIPMEANLFNGVLISSVIVNKIGFPRPELFIRGDEVEYTERMKKNKIKFGTAINCYFYHPSDRNERYKILFGLLNARDAKNDFKNYYLFRNKAFFFKEKKQLWLVPLDSIRYAYYFLIHKKFDIHGFLLWIKATRDGLNGKLGRHPIY